MDNKAWLAIFAIMEKNHGVIVDRISLVVLRGVSNEGRLIGREACNQEQEGDRHTRVRQV